MGPAPMIRMVEMSVRLGISSQQRLIWAQKKGAHSARPLGQCGREPLARGPSLDQILKPCNPQKGAINRDFPAICLKGQGPAFALRATARQPSPRSACQAEAAE